MCADKLKAGPTTASDVSGTESADDASTLILPTSASPRPAPPLQSLTSPVIHGVLNTVLSCLLSATSPANGCQGHVGTGGAAVQVLLAFHAVCRGGTASRPPSYWSTADDSTGPASDCSHQLRQLLYCTTSLLHCVIVSALANGSRALCVECLRRRRNGVYKGRLREGICVCGGGAVGGACVLTLEGCVCVVMQLLLSSHRPHAPSLLLRIF